MGNENGGLLILSELSDFGEYLGNGIILGFVAIVDILLGNTTFWSFY